MKPREVPSWREYWMNQAKSIATRSKDPSSQVGCVLVDDKDSIGQGYNGFPPDCDESKLTWVRPMKYFCVVHAEMNAVFRAGDRITPTTIAYVTDGPCENCLKHMLAVGIKEIYYNSPKIMHERSSMDQKVAIKMLIEATGAKVQNFHTGEDYVEDLHKPIPEQT
jgi:dCMP deaminase